jgi:hypothetical protein
MQVLKAARSCACTVSAASRAPLACSQCCTWSCDKSCNKQKQKVAEGLAAEATCSCAACSCASAYLQQHSLTACLISNRQVWLVADVAVGSICSFLALAQPRSQLQERPRACRKHAAGLIQEVPQRTRAIKGLVPDLLRQLRGICTSSSSGSSGMCYS